MKRNLNSVGFALFAAASILVTGAIWNTLQNSAGGSSSREYAAMFTDASGLRNGDTVRVAGVRAGRVDKVELDGNQAKVTFSLASASSVYANTRAAIRYQNLLGQRYLSLELAGTPARALPPRSVIPTERTDDSIDLTVLLNGFEPLLANLDPQDVNAVATSLVQALQGEGGQVESFLTEFNKAATSFNRRDEVFAQVIDNVTPVLEDIATSSDDFDALVVQSSRLVNGLARQSDTWGPAVDKINRLAGSAQDLADRSEQPAEKALTQLNSTLDTYLAEKEALVDTLNEFPGFANSIARVGMQGSFLSVYPCHVDASIPRFFPPQILNQLGGHLHTEVC